jgi:hypothetical protein
VLTSRLTPVLFVAAFVAGLCGCAGAPTTGVAGWCAPDRPLVLNWDGGEVPFVSESGTFDLSCQRAPGGWVVFLEGATVLRLQFTGDQVTLLKTKSNANSWPYPEDWPYEEVAELKANEAISLGDGGSFEVVTTE